MTRRLTLSAVLAAALLIAAVAPAAPAAGASPIAPASACPNQARLAAPAAAQEEAMLCMTNYARVALGLGELGTTPALEMSAADKARDILRCDNFSHDACGREFTFWMRETGYLAVECWKAGENLAWGTGSYGTVGSIFRAWMRSDGHRENILGNYSQIGIDVEVGTLAGAAKTRVWTQHFGLHC